MSGRAVVIGFGVTGINAARHLVDHGVEPAQLIVVDRSTTAAERATAFGARVVVGDGTDRRVLARATSEHVRQVIVAVVPDEAALLATMHARELCPTATIATAVRESAHVAFARRHGADHVVATAEAAGEMLGLAVHLRHEPRATNVPRDPSTT